MGGGCSKEKGDTHDDHQKVDPSLKPIVAGEITDYAKNEIKEIKVTPEFTILVSEFEGHFYAYGSKCPHYGAPLAKGSLVDGLIRCPWHGACFDIRTGEIEDYPGLDCIPTYLVKRTDMGHLTVYPSNYGIYKVQRPLASVKNSEELFLILGAGASGLTAAQTLREKGFHGRILMITQDAYLPYDRTKLSKSLGITWDSAKLRDDNWFKEAQIEIMLNATIKSLDVEEQKVIVDGMDAPLSYHKVLIATGMRPRVPTSHKNGVIGSDLKNVLTLYDLRDSRRIKERANGKTVVIVGAGFIGMELIGPLSAIANKIYVVHRNRRPYGVVLGDTVGRLIQQSVINKYKKNVVFLSCDGVKEIFGNSNKEVEKVLTLKKRQIKCEVVIFAMGGVPNTEFLLPYKAAIEDDGFKLPEDPALGMNRSGEIPVNEFMETHLKNHYACGDIVRFPTRVSVSNRAQVGHWGMAQKMGATAALKMLGKEDSIFNTVPFFWSNVGGLTIRYVGFGEHYNHSVIFGDLKALKFCVLYKRGWKILAACTCNCDPIAARLSFDIQDNIHHEDSYPPYITKVFPAPPIIGDTIFGLKYFMEDEITEFDLLNHVIKGNYIPRRPKNFKQSAHNDMEYINKPLMSTYEKLYYKNAKQIPSSTSTKKDVLLSYDPIRLNFQRLQLYKDTRFHFAKDFATKKVQKPMYW